MSVFIALFTDYTLRNVALGSALLGVVGGVLGCFAVLRRQGLIGDALAHAALPGVCVAYLLTGAKAPLVVRQCCYDWYNQCSFWRAFSVVKRQFTVA